MEPALPGALGPGPGPPEAVVGFPAVQRPRGGFQEMVAVADPFLPGVFALAAQRLYLGAERHSIRIEPNRIFARALGPGLETLKSLQGELL